MPDPTVFLRRSFVYRRLGALGFSFASIGDAALAAARSGPPGGGALWLLDLSVRQRWGIKGRGAFAWLAARGAVVPDADHRAKRDPDGTLVARLSPAEALILGPMGGGRCELGAAVEKLPAAGAGACYPVPRRDSHAWFLLCGHRAPEMFAKLCGVDLSPGSFPDGGLAQTSVARLSAVVIRDDLPHAVAFHLLADSASADYLWDCVLDAMAEFGGAVAGSEVLAEAAARRHPL